MLDNLSYYTLEAREEHYKSLLRQAESEMRLRQALANQPKPPSIYAPFLAWLGSQLVELGSRLEKTYHASTREIQNLEEAAEPCA